MEQVRRGVVVVHHSLYITTYTVPDVIRKQVYITEEQAQALALQAEETDRSQSELIREAIDRILADRERERRSATLRATAGLWSDRTDLPDWSSLRREGDTRMDVWRTEDRNAS